MVKAPRYLPDVLSGAVLAVLAIIAVIAWPLREPSASRTNEPGFTATPAAQTETAGTKPSAPAVAGLFGYRLPAPAPTAPRQSLPPVDQTAAWIKYMGYVTDESGQAKYFFKDTRSGQVLNLYLGRDNGRGWKLVSITPTLYTIENNGTIMKVPK